MTTPSTPVGSTDTSNTAGAASATGTSAAANTSSPSWLSLPDVFQRGPVTLVAWCTQTVRIVAFWAVVVLPCYAIWLLFGGLLATEVPAFLATMLFDCCALLVSHTQRSPSVSVSQPVP